MMWDQVVELGSVSVLTMGDGSYSMEQNCRPLGGMEPRLVELGSAATLTMGGKGGQWERIRPNAFRDV
jgi:hypothetical protein